MSGELAEQFEAIHTYPIREVCTIIFAGRPTEVGLRGYPAVQTIIAAGADDQRSEVVLHLLFGDAARGLDQFTGTGTSSRSLRCPGGGHRVLVLRCADESR